MSKNESFKNESSKNIKTQQRLFQGTVEIHSDCFKLLVASGNVNKSWNGGVDLQTYEHVHWFHTYDSDGKKLTTSNSVGGHFHIIELEDSGDGIPKVKSVSGPLRKARKKVRGKWQVIDEPLPEELEDNHTHKIEYIKSSKVAMRTIDPRAVAIQTEEAQKTAPIEGVR